MPTNEQRKEAYRFYRSLGYTSKEAANLRNKSPTRLSDEYRQETRARRRARDDWEGDEPPEKQKPLYRPDIAVEDPNDYLAQYRATGLPERFLDQIIDHSGDDLIALEVYADRFSGLAGYFDSQAAAGNSEYGTWKNILELLGDIDDLGDFLDALGELYDESEGN